jgi:hypothetical protein
MKRFKETGYNEYLTRVCGMLGDGWVCAGVRSQFFTERERISPNPLFLKGAGGKKPESGRKILTATAEKNKKIKRMNI